MAVIAVWKCDRDGSMFEDKKAADAHDKMLELADSITHLITTDIPGIKEEDAEAIGLLLAKRRDDLVKACKGKTDVFLTPSEEETSPQSTADAHKKVTPISG